MGIQNTIVGIKPLKDDIAKTLKIKPKLLERKRIIPRVLDKILGFVEKFYDDIGTEGSTADIVEADRFQENEMLMVAEPKEKYNNK